MRLLVLSVHWLNTKQLNNKPCPWEIWWCKSWFPVLEAVYFSFNLAKTRAVVWLFVFN
jgi:hypothetical protein